jgi:hypothetical protein
METGLLWYDGDPKRSLEDKIGQAAERYREKYGRWPNTCYVHPQAAGNHAGDELDLAYQARNPRTTIRVISAPNILLHHFWVGENNQQASPQLEAAH